MPALGAELGATSVSGLSAGAYMAGQFQIAHSSIVKGAGIIAGGPYGCAESAFCARRPGNLSKAINGCMLDAMQVWGMPNPELLDERARKLANLDRIDATEAWRAAASICSAAPKIASWCRRSWRRRQAVFGSGRAGRAGEAGSDIGAGHAFVTEDKGLACGRTGEPYITDCDYDQAGVLLGHIYGRAAAARGTAGRRVHRCSTSASSRAT